MKVARLVLAVLFALALLPTAFAQQGPGPQPQTGGKTATPEDFNAKKTRILKMIEERRAHLDQAKTCVEAAKTDADLQKCRPEHPMGMGPGMRHGGPGMGPGPGMGGGQRPPIDQQ